MQIDRLYYPVRTLGYGNRLGLWMIGCSRRCPGCSNPELRAFVDDHYVSVSEIARIIAKLRNDIDGVTITGGEPFEQAEELLSLLIEVERLGIDDCLVYTGYTFDELQQGTRFQQECLKHIGVLIDGEYKQELNNNLGIRGSTNQQILILKNSLASRYGTAVCCSRKSELVNSNGVLINIGIPKKI